METTPSEAAPFVSSSRTGSSRSRKTAPRNCNPRTTAPSVLAMASDRFRRSFLAESLMRTCSTACHAATSTQPANSRPYIKVLLRLGCISFRPGSAARKIQRVPLIFLQRQTVEEKIQLLLRNRIGDQLGLAGFMRRHGRELGRHLDDVR